MESKNIQFDVVDDVLKLGVNVACFIMEGMTNRESSGEFEPYRAEATRRLLQDLSPENIKSDPILLGFRLLHQRIGCSNRKNLAASENLLKMLYKTGTWPHVNLLVDIYNLVSLTSRLALGAHDADHLGGNVHLRMTDGTENFFPIGAQGPDQVKAGEYAYVDDDNDIICRLEVRQVEKSKVSLETVNCFYIVQGNPVTDSEYLRIHTEKLIELTQRFCGGQERMLYKPW